MLLDTFSSKWIAVVFPYDRNDRRRLKGIELGSIFCDRMQLIAMYRKRSQMRVSV